MDGDDGAKVKGEVGVWGMSFEDENGLTRLGNNTEGGLIRVRQAVDRGAETNVQQLGLVDGLGGLDGLVIGARDGHGGDVGEQRELAEVSAASRHVQDDVFQLYIVA